MKINQECGFQCETFALAVHVLDCFLGFVKVHGKYLKCATLASYYIALKLLEEEEFVPALSNFVIMTGNKFTCNDITRMEKIILEKTNWNLNHITICSFLEMVIFFNFPVALKILHVLLNVYIYTVFDAQIKLKSWALIPHGTINMKLVVTKSWFCLDMRNRCSLDIVFIYFIIWSLLNFHILFVLSPKSKFQKDL